MSYLASLFFIICMWFVPQVAHAQVKPSLTLSPAKYDLVVEPGQIQQAGVKLTNNAAVSIPINTEVMDFSPTDKVGGITFGESLPNHSAKGWMKATPSTFILEPGATEVIRVDITPPDTLTMGSYFGTVMFKAELPSSYFGEGDQTHIVPWMGELFLLRYGDIPKLDDQSLTVTKFEIPKMAKGNKVPMTLEVQNNTQFHLAPETDFALQGIGGKVVAHVVQDETTIMPGTSRKFDVVVERNRPLGIYRPNATLRVAGYERSVSSSPIFLMTVVGLILVSGLILSLPHGLLYLLRNRRMIRKRVSLIIRVLIGKN